jgi:hypothetical protein
MQVSTLPRILTLYALTHIKHVYTGKCEDRPCAYNVMYVCMHTQTDTHRGKCEDRPSAYTVMYVCMYVCTHKDREREIQLLSLTNIKHTTLTHTGKCEDRSCAYTVRLSKLSPADCLSPKNCHVICGYAGWCIHDNSEGTQGLLKTLYTGTQCTCPGGVVVKVCTYTYIHTYAHRCTCI